MKFRPLLVPNVGESGDLKKTSAIRKRAVALGKKGSVGK